MAEVNHFYAEENTAQTSTSASYADVVTIAGSSLSASTKYLVIARALFGVQDTTDKGQLRIRSDDTTIESKSETIIEFQQTGATDLKSWLFVHSFTTDASPGDVAIVHNVAGGSTVTTDQASLLLIDLDDLGSANYFEDINAATGTELGTTAWGDVLASIAAADLGTTEEWLALGYAKLGVGSTGGDQKIRLQGADDASTASTLNEISEEGEDTSAERMLGVVGRHKAVTTAVDLQIQAYETAGNHNVTDEGSYLIALKASAFADFEHDYTAATQAITTEATIATVGPYTPTTNGNHLIIGRTGTSAGTADGAELQLHLEDGTTETRTGDSTLTHDQGWDGAKDAEPAFTMERISISTAKTYNLRATGGTWTAEDRWLLVLNLNLAGGGGAATVEPAVIAATTAFPTPTAKGAATVTPAAISATATLPTPIPGVPVTVTPVVIATTATVPTPDIAAAATVTPAAITAVASLPLPAALAAATIIPSTIATVASFPASTITVAPTVNPAVIGATTTIPPPTILAAALVTPVAIAASVTVPIPVAAAASTVTPVVIAATSTLPTPSIVTGGVTAQPSVIVTVATLPLPTAQGQGLVTPSVIAATVTLPTPTVAAGKVVTPAVIATTSALPTPTITAAALIIPATIAAVATAPTPTAQGAVIIVPTTIVASTAFPAPTARGQGASSPTVIATTVTLPNPTAAGQGNVTPAAIVTTTTLPTPTIDIGGGPTTVTPLVIATTTTLPLPTVLAASVVTPGVIAAVGTVPTPTVVGGSSTTVTPVVITTTTAFGSVTVTGAANVYPVAIYAPATIPTPSLDGILISITDGYDIAAFYRNGATRFSLVIALPRSGGKGFRSTEGWERCSGPFALPTRGRQAALVTVQDVWIANTGTDTATLTSLINAELNTAGYRRPNKVLIT